jgi:transposase
MKITRCKLSKNVQYGLLEFFVLEVAARSVADIMGILQNSAAFFYCKIRQVIAFNLAAKAHEVFQGDIEIDESYFGGVRKGKRGRGASGEVVVFGMLKRHGKVYTVVVENTKAKALFKEIALKMKPDSVVYTDA